MAFSSTLVARGVLGSLSYKVYSYATTNPTTGGNITIPKSTVFVAWTPSTVRASATINWTTTPGTCTLAALTTTDTGYITVYFEGSN
jgi:hypothetical protein